MVASTTPPSVDLARLSGGSVRVGVACSGGTDSIALLHAAVQAALADGHHHVVALHVHHGLLPEADGWLTTVQALCAQWALAGWPVSCQAARLNGHPAPGDSVEAWARDHRHRALADLARQSGCQAVLLGHHARDQAETFLMQALCGGGVAALAAMPDRREQHGVVWHRPWLGASRSDIDAYAARHALQGVTDPSNQDVRFTRSRLRSAVMPALRTVFPGTDVDRALSRAAHHQGDVLACLRLWLDDAWGRVVVPDPAQPASRPMAMQVDLWANFDAGPRRELLREWFRRASGAVMPVGLLQEVERTLLRGASTHCHWAWRPRRTLDGDSVEDVAGEVWLYRGLLRWVAGATARAEPTRDAMASEDPRWPLSLKTPGWHALPDGWGWLHLREATEGGVNPVWLQEAQLRRRGGGERFCLGAGRPSRDLKKQFQSLGVPSWARQGPLIWHGDTLLFVPGLGLDFRALAQPGEPQWRLTWQPGPPC